MGDRLPNYDPATFCLSRKILKQIWTNCKKLFLWRSLIAYSYKRMYFHILLFTSALLPYHSVIINWTQVKHFKDLLLTQKRIKYWINFPINLIAPWKAHHTSLSREESQSGMLTKLEQNSKRVPGVRLFETSCWKI